MCFLFQSTNPNVVIQIINYRTIFEKAFPGIENLLDCQNKS